MITSRSALSRRRVIETGGGPSAYCAKLFADLGADVIKVEPPEGDRGRREAPFLEADRERAVSRAHLTARQAGAIARWARVRHLKRFHFSPRYENGEDELWREAEDEFSGREAHYGEPP